MVKKYVNKFWQNKSRFLVTPFCFAIVVSCGKKPENSTAQTNQVEVAPALEAESILINLEFNPAEEQVKTRAFNFSNAAWVKIPEFPFFKSGNRKIVNTTIYFNANEIQSLSGNQMVYCKYLAIRKDDPSLPDGYKHFFKGCFEDIDNDGIDDEINYQPGTEIPVDEEKNIILKVEAGPASENIEVEVDVEVDWR